MGKKFTSVLSILYSSGERKRRKGRWVSKRQVRKGEGRKGEEEKVVTRRKGNIVGLPVRAIFKIFNESLALAPHYENTV